MIDQYLFVIGQKLPFRGRTDILTELKSIILDNIEEQYGSAPNESEVKDFLKSFGNPDEVARRYTGEKQVISSKFTDFYFLLLKVVFGALSIAFLVVFIISLFNGQHNVSTLLKLGGMYFGNLLNGWFCATGIITVMFIVASRFNLGKVRTYTEDWNPDELEAVILEHKETPRILYPIGIAAFSICLVLLNIWPSVVSFIENLFFGTGIGEGISHRIHIPTFAIFIRVLSVFWVCEIIVIFCLLKNKIGSGMAEIIKQLIAIGTIIVYGIMIFSSNLYMEYNGMVGFKLIFIIVAIVETAELFGNLLKHGINAVQKVLE